MELVSIACGVRGVRRKESEGERTTGDVCLISASMCALLLLNSKTAAALSLRQTMQGLPPSRRLRALSLDAGCFSRMPRVRVLQYY